MCDLVFKNPSTFLDNQQDYERYSSHQNASDDAGYRNFLGRIIIPLKKYLPLSFDAIDFGCGPGPTLSLLLEDLGGNVVNYDPHFFFEKSILIPENYDVVTCTEVAEHFKNPKEDWDLLVSLVKKGGVLALMTQMFSKDIDYEKWWYKNDPTHVVFYQEKTFFYIANNYGLEIIYNDQKSIVIFKKR